MPEIHIGIRTLLNKLSKFVDDTLQRKLVQGAFTAIFSLLRGCYDLMPKSKMPKDKRSKNNEKFEFILHFLKAHTG
jgi:hypothetical protein